MHLLVTRPEPDATRQAEMLAALGHEPVLAPLLRIEFVQGVRLDLESAQALVVTSRNALRALGAHPALAEALSLPLIAVGEATAKAAMELGFATVTAGPGTAAALASSITERLADRTGPLVHLSGEATAFDLKSALADQGFELREAILYRSVPAGELPPEALALLKSGGLDGVILMSPRAASIFTRLVLRQGAVTQAAGLVCYCLSGAVAQALEPLKARALVAAHPREDDVLALIGAGAASS